MEVALVFNIILPLVAAVTTAFGTVLALNETMNCIEERGKDNERFKQGEHLKKAQIPPG